MWVDLADGLRVRAQHPEQGAVFLEACPSASRTRRLFRMSLDIDKEHVSPSSAAATAAIRSASPADAVSSQWPQQVRKNTRPASRIAGRD